MVKVLFVCLGNICRSPTAEGVFRLLIEREGLGDRIIVDSAGTGACGIDDDPVAQALPFDQQPEHPFGGGRTADIAETDEQYLDQGIPSKNVPYWPSGHLLDYHEPLAVRQDEK